MDSCAEEKNTLCQAVMNHINTPDRFSALSHIRLLELSPDGCARAEMDICTAVLNPMGGVHGGALATLADTTAGSGARAATGHTVLTVNCNLSYLRAAQGSKVTCIARPEKAGRRICVMHADLFDEAGRKVVTGELTFCVMAPLDSEAL